MALQQFRDMKIVRFIYLLLLQILMVSSLHSPAVALNLGKFQTMIGSLSIGEFEKKISFDLEVIAAYDKS